ncbi:Beta-Casp domain [Trinorchestia longiramus]|nr:Beta-Casp domain [Trinorchestia longiramus]
MAEIKITPLGAGQDVGRSCILASIGDKHIMLDCGMHMGFNDERRFPDFSYITDGSLTEHLDCVIISHFHLDHCGALPYMTEMVGYTGPIYMTQPTKALCPVLLEDMRKVAVERKGETNFFTSSMIKDCMKKVTTVALHETVKVDEELEIKAYYAGHVLGAAMFQVKVGSHSLVYTGDYNMTPDRHLGAAWIDKCRPDLLITESTYATTIRDSKRCRERDFLKKIHSCVDRGGKVLIPVFALGRVQELCILLDTYWDRMNLTVPVYFTMGLAETVTNGAVYFMGLAETVTNRAVYFMGLAETVTNGAVYFMGLAETVTNGAVYFIRLFETVTNGPVYFTMGFAETVTNGAVYFIGLAKTVTNGAVYFMGLAETVTNGAVYFTMGLAETANKYYRMFITWTNQKIRRTFVHRNMFDFKHIKPFDKSYIDNPGPMVVFATPGMLHAGLSLAVFKKWAPHEQNMVSPPKWTA